VGVVEEVEKTWVATSGSGGSSPDARSASRRLARDIMYVAILKNVLFVVVFELPGLSILINWDCCFRVAFYPVIMELFALEENAIFVSRSAPAINASWPNYSCQCVHKFRLLLSFGSC
jgi:hypothetical protein